MKRTASNTQSARGAIMCSMALSVLLVATGCVSTARKQPAELERFRVTALQGDPRLAVMIARNDDCTFEPATETQSCIAQDVTPKQSEWFVRCLAGGFRDSSYHPDIRSLDTDAALRAVLGQLPMDKLLSGEVAGGLADSGVLARLEQEHVSHVVTFAFKLTRNYRRENRGESATTGAGANGGIGVGGTSVRYFRVDFSGSVIDVRAAALAGRITTHAEGGSGVGGGIGIMVPIPIPIPIIFPVFDNLDAKEDSCEVLGDAVVRFLYSKARPASDAATP
jgi:hypothetical protein